jgi:putative membrane protein insertion efficiency factor
MIRESAGPRTAGPPVPRVAPPHRSRFGPKRIFFSLLVLCVALLGADLSRAADRQVSARLLSTGIHVYQHTLGPMMPVVGVQCRFTPTCSHYADAVIQKHGALVGSWMTLKRLLRCGPWTAMGTVDEPQ